MPTINQLIRNRRRDVPRKVKTKDLEGAPQKRGV
jgi:ribosomal protein S12